MVLPNPLGAPCHIARPRRLRPARRCHSRVRTRTRARAHRVLTAATRHNAATPPRRRVLVSHPQALDRVADALVEATASASYDLMCGVP